MTGPTPRGVRRCRICGDRCGGPLDSVVALCLDCTMRATPRGTAEQMREQYNDLIARFGWQSA